MKKLLLILIIVFAGIDCHAQLLKDEAYIIATTFNLLSDQIDKLTEKQKKESASFNFNQRLQSGLIQQLIDQTTKLTIKIDSLEKRITELEKYRNLDPDSLSDPSIYVPHRDTISWFDYYHCLEPPKDKIVTVWQKGRATTWIHGIDSITFKDK
jgi:hypothetical protein